MIVLLQATMRSCISCLCACFHSVYLAIFPRADTKEKRVSKATLLAQTLNVGAGSCAGAPLQVCSRLLSLWFVAPVPR